MPGMVGKIKLYLSTDVLLSLLTDEEKGGAKLGENVAKLLYRAAEGSYQVMVSEHTANELLKAGVPRELVDQALRPMLLLNGSDLLLANGDILRGALKISRVSEMPFLRALHIVFAQRNNAVIVSRDFELLHAARSLAGVMKPEDLLSM
ncbi:MAG TPA: type II toxin-antitoxin system VapC family toxin [Methanocella sp.]|nr:type II toxin-antitoxin system VapC family toxin [Methanocella sp.]